MNNPAFVARLKSSIIEEQKYKTPKHYQQKGRKFYYDSLDQDSNEKLKTYQ